MKINNWYVIDTPCYPARFKVVNDYYKQDNATHNYFQSNLEAAKEANRRNKEEITKMLNVTTN